ncbi:MAG: ferredoxin [Minisyncoccales bacterium]
MAKIKKVNVNDKCIGCGLCSSICPEVFEMGEDGKAHAKEANFDDCAEKIIEARDSCPVSAIEVEEE